MNIVGVGFTLSINVPSHGRLYRLHQCPSIKYQMTVVSFVCLTANDVKSAQRNEWEDVELVAFDHGLIQLIHHYSTLFVKHMHKILEDFKVKRRC